MKIGTINNRLLVGMFCVGAALGVRGELVASYNDGIAEDALALANLASAASVTVTDLSVVGFGVSTRAEFGTPITPAGPTAGSSAGSAWLFARSSDLQATPDAVTDYFGFTVAADAGKTLNLESFKFDLVTIANLISDPQYIATAQLYYAVDGGTSFATIGSALTSAATVATVFAPVESANIDLSGITGASSVEFRLGLGDTRDSTARAAWIQGIQLNGTVIPEPATLGLLGAFGGGMLFIRRRFMI
jgi:hypothetical protein